MREVANILAQNDIDSYIFDREQLADVEMAEDVWSAETMLEGP